MATTAKTAGRDEVVAKVQQSLSTSTKREVSKKEAELITKAVLDTVAELITENIHHDGFSLKLGDLGKFSVKHVAGTLRKNPFKNNEITKTRDKRKVKFVSLGKLRTIETL